MNWQTFVKDYFSFSKKERTGIVVLVLIVIVVVLLPFVKEHTSSEKIKPVDTSWLTAANRLQKSSPPNPSRQTDYENNTSATPYDRGQKTERISYKEPPFYFDPNTLDADGFKRLGLRDKTIRILMNYRNKGGRFRKSEDLKKIYTLQPDEYERLDPYIRIAAQKEVHTFSQNKMPLHVSAIEVPSATRRLKSPPRLIDINTADTSAFQSLYGIGSRRSFRIVHFRNKLGGFYSVDQVGETYGVPDSVFKKIKRFLTVSSPDLRKININHAGYDELNHHPYISSRLAFLILKHRKERGNFSNIEEVKEIIVQTSDSYDKVSKYITVE